MWKSKNNYIKPIVNYIINLRAHCIAFHHSGVMSSEAWRFAESSVICFYKKTHVMTVFQYSTLLFHVWRMMAHSK